MVLDPIPQSLPVHFFGSRPQPPTSRGRALYFLLTRIFDFLLTQMSVLTCGFSFLQMRSSGTARKFADGVTTAMDAVPILLQVYICHIHLFTYLYVYVQMCIYAHDFYSLVYWSIKKWTLFRVFCRYTYARVSLNPKP